MKVKSVPPECSIKSN